MTSPDHKRLELAIRWALGEMDDFPAREDGQGAYWWRKELRERAGLSVCMPPPSATPVPPVTDAMVAPALPRPEEP